MEDLDKIIGMSSLEIKRALCVKLIKLGIPLEEICRTLQVQPSFIKKWRAIYNKEGAINFTPKYKGSQGFLNADQREDIKLFLQAKETCDLETLISYISQTHAVVFQSKQSYYDILKNARMSWKKTEKVNPKKDDELVANKKEVIKKNSIKGRRKYSEGIWSY